MGILAGRVAISSDGGGKHPKEIAKGPDEYEPD